MDNYGKFPMLLTLLCP